MRPGAGRGLGCVSVGSRWSLTHGVLGAGACQCAVLICSSPTGMLELPTSSLAVLRPPSVPSLHFLLTFPKSTGSALPPRCPPAGPSLCCGTSVCCGRALSNVPTALKPPAQPSPASSFSYGLPPVHPSFLSPMILFLH